MPMLDQIIINLIIMFISVGTLWFIFPIKPHLKMTARIENGPNCQI